MAGRSGGPQPLPEERRLPERYHQECGRTGSTLADQRATGRAMVTLFRILWVVTLLSRARTLFVTAGARRLALEAIVGISACGAALLLAWSTLGLFVVLGILSLAGVPNTRPAAEICGAVSVFSFCLVLVVVRLLRRTGLWAFVGKLGTTPPSPR